MNFYWISTIHSKYAQFAPDRPYTPSPAQSLRPASPSYGYGRAPGRRAACRPCSGPARSYWPHPPGHSPAAPGGTAAGTHRSSPRLFREHTPASQQPTHTEWNSRRYTPVRTSSVPGTHTGQSTAHTHRVEQPPVYTGPHLVCSGITHRTVNSPHTHRVEQPPVHTRSHLVCTENTHRPVNNPHTPSGTAAGTHRSAPRLYQDHTPNSQQPTHTPGGTAAGTHPFAPRLYREHTPTSQQPKHTEWNSRRYTPVRTSSVPGTHTGQSTAHTHRVEQPPVHTRPHLACTGEQATVHTSNNTRGNVIVIGFNLRRMNK